LVLSAAQRAGPGGAVAVNRSHVDFAAARGGARPAEVSGGGGGGAAALAVLWDR